VPEFPESIPSLFSITIIRSWCLFIRRIYAQIHVKEIMNGHIYDTESSLLIGERKEGGTFMYKTRSGNYFIYHATSLKTGNPPWINPISRSVAIRRHFRYSLHQMPFQEAFGE